MITVSAKLDKGEHCAVHDSFIVADTGNASADIFNGLTDSDEIFRKSISCGYVDHHVINGLPAMVGKEPKYSTQMVVDYADEVLKYIKTQKRKQCLLKLNKLSQNKRFSMQIN